MKRKKAKLINKNKNHKKKNIKIRKSTKIRNTIKIK